MPRKVCYFPIKVRVGELAEPRLEELGRAVSAALTARLDAARHQLAAEAAGRADAQVTVRPHLPESVQFDGDPGEARRGALERVLLEAVARAVAALQPPEGLPTAASPPGARAPAGPAPTVATDIEDSTTVGDVGDACADGTAGRVEWIAPSNAEDAEVTHGHHGTSLRLAMSLSGDLVDAEDLPKAPTGQGPQQARLSAPAAVPTASAPSAAPPTGPAPTGPEQSGAAPPPPEPTTSARSDRPEEPGKPPAAEPETPEPAKDEVAAGPSVFEGHVVMHLLGGRVVTVGGADRHVRASSMIRAVQLGAGIFGTQSFVILEGPVGEPDSRLWAVATTPSVSDRELKRIAEGWPLKGGDLQMVTVGGGEVLRSVIDDAGRRYVVHTVVSQEGNFLTPDPAAGTRLAERLRTGGPKLAPAKARELVFGDLDDLVEQVLEGADDRLQEAADRLALLGVVAFSLVDWQTKARYLEVLVQAWTWEKHEHAIVEIMRSLESIAELDAVRAVLAQHKIDEQLFRDIGDTLWSLLTTVGERFGNQRRFTVAELSTLFDEAFQTPPEVRESLRRSLLEGGTLRLGMSVLLQIESAAVAVVDMLLGMIEGLALMVTRPAQMIEGLGQLVRLLLMFELAGLGYRPAQAECAAVVKHIGPQLVHGLQGAALLHIGERVTAKIKWAVVVEVASWFVGFGEIKAAAAAVGLTEKLALVLRILAALGKVAETAEGEVVATRLVRLATAMRAGSDVLRVVREDKDVLALLYHLPVDDQRRLVSMLERFEVREGSTLAELAAHPDLGPALEAVQRKTELLHTFAMQSGGLSEELGRSFRHLAGPQGFDTPELARLADVLEDGEGRVLLATMEHIGLPRIGPGREVDMDLLTVLAAKGMRMDAVREVGFDVVRAAVNRSAGDVRLLDTILLDLARLQNEAREGNRMAEYAELLSRLTQDERAAWSRVAGGAALRAGDATVVAQRAVVLERITALRARYQHGVAESAVVKRLLDGLVRRSRKDPWLVTEILDRFEARRLDRAGSYADEADLAAAWKDAEKWAGHDERALLHEPDEVPPDALSLSEQRHQHTAQGGRPSQELADNMARAHNPRPPGHETHHIVPEGDPRAEIARRILEDAGIQWRNAAENGIHLPRTSMDPRTVPQAYTRHPTLHTDAYYKELTLRLIEAKHNSTVRETLAAIGEELLNGQFFHVEDNATKGQRFAELLMERRADIDWLTDEEFLDIVEAAERRTTRAGRSKP
ncbi:AHH domain-containing protein [Streptomyces sp. NPDC098781]|uniref:AHH domain-containing protein n=1 Tax=Streptomyces sp. NPDC098781 TaxID=3366097 RepID=UPI0037F7B634